MKKTIKTFGLIMLSLLTVCVCGCSLVLPDGNDGNNAAEHEDALCGLFMIFYDGDRAITEEDFTNDEAIKIYFGKHYYSEEKDNFYWESIDGRDVLSDIAIDYKINELDDVLTGYDVSITASLRYTKALTEYKMLTYNIYFDEEQRTYYTSDPNANVNWDGLGSIGQSQTIKLYDQNPEGVLYNFEITINFVKINSVAQLNIIEFYGENNAVKKTDNYLGIDYRTSEACQYVIIEEISQGGEGDAVRRTLVEKGEDGVSTFTHYIPDEYGLTESQQLRINFPDRLG